MSSHSWTNDNSRCAICELRRKRTGMLNNSPKPSFKIKIKLSIYFKIKVPELEQRAKKERITVAWSPVWSFHSPWWSVVMCWCWSTVFSEAFQETLEHFVQPSADKLYGDYIPQQNSVPARTAKSTKSWFNEHGATMLDWPATLPWTQQKIYGLLSKGRWGTLHLIIQMTCRLLLKQPGLSLHLCTTAGWTPLFHNALM